MLLLDEKKKSEINKTWHRSYHCTGIKHCEYAHPDMLRICQAYNDVKLEKINDFRKKYTFQPTSAPIFERLKRQTEAFFNAYKDSWEEERGPCTFRNTRERICQGQKIEVFTRNEVSVHLTHTLHMLIISR